jgi:hypothetical protein
MVSYMKSNDMYIWCQKITIYLVDQQMHTSKIYLSYIIHYLHVSVAVVTIIRVPAQQYC